MLGLAFLSAVPLQGKRFRFHVETANTRYGIATMMCPSKSKTSQSGDQPLNDPPSGNPPDTPSSRRAPPRRRLSAFEATLDNLTMKRMGRGTQYYGERVEADVDDAESIATEDADGSETESLGDLRPDAVVVTGGTGRTGQWVCLGLANNGFTVRVVTRSIPRAEAIFGPAGSNVDIFNADITQTRTLARAFAAASALVICSAAPRWLPFSHEAVDVRGVENAVRMAVKAGSVRRVILISDAGVSSVHARAKRRSEQIVKDCGIPYVIVRAAALRDAEGGRRQIDVRPVVSDSTALKIKPVTRIDLAQCICQALVHHRRIETILQEDPTSGASFPNCVVTIANSDGAYVPNRRFWTSVFSRVSETFTVPSETEEEMGDNDSEDVT